MPYLFALLGSVGLFALYVATRPGAFRIERSLTIPAGPEALHALINDFHAWSRWSPWEKLDPGMTRAFEGPTSGVGAVYRWSGKKSGTGAMTITASAPTRVEIALEFIKPFPAQNTAIFTLTPDGEGTRVTWAMEGHRTFGFKAFGVFVNMDDLVGKDFASGLAAMKDAVAGG
jgi:hypothetical protein